MRRASAPGDSKGANASKGDKHHKKVQAAVDAVQAEHAREVVLLEDKIHRLEAALASVIAASDEVLIDLEEQRVLAAASNSFAAAWGDLEDDFITSDITSAELANANRYASAREDFFGLTHVDLRARKWLLK